MLATLGWGRKRCCYSLAGFCDHGSVTPILIMVGMQSVTFDSSHPTSSDESVII